MKPLDRLLQRWRIAQAARFIPPGAYLLDIGCHDGALFRRLGSRLGGGVGIDPLAPATVPGATGFRLVRGVFPRDLPAGETFDVVTGLAVLEHVPAAEQAGFLAAVAACLRAGGVLLLTVPSPAVDTLLRGLRRVRLADGMSLEEHHGFDPNETPRLGAAAGLQLKRHQRFELGLNHLFVFRRPPAAD